MLGEKALPCVKSGMISRLARIIEGVSLKPSDYRLLPFIDAAMRESNGPSQPRLIAAKPMPSSAIVDATRSATAIVQRADGVIDFASFKLAREQRLYMGKIRLG